MNANDIVGTPRETWVWLAPDWSDYQEGEARPARGANWTRVKIRETLYADGRVVRAVLDANGQPVAADGTPATAETPARPLDSTPQFDPAQEKRWKDQQTQQGRGDQEGDIRGPQTGPNREVYRGGRWVVEANPVYQPPAAQGAKEWRTEGTPDPNAPGGFDNARPIMAAYVNGQRTGETRQPTGKELADWNEAGQRQRNPGGKTDADLERERQEAADRNKPGALTIKPDGKGGSLGIQTMPDGSIRTTPLPNVPSDRPNPERVTVNGTVYERDPQTGAYAPARGLPTAGAAEPDGAPQAALTLGNVTRDLQTYAEFLNSKVQQWQRTSGREGLSPDQADKLLQKRRDLAQSAVQEQTAIVNAQRGIYGDELSQRGQDIGETQSRRTAANAATSKLSDYLGLIDKLGPGGGQLLANAIASSNDAALSNAGRWGGLRDAPPVELPPFLAQLRGRAPGAIETGAPPAVSASAAAAPPSALPSAGQAADIMANPVFRPAPPALIAPAPAAAGAPAMGAVSPPGAPSSNVGQIGDPMTQPPAINQATGEPTGLAPLPVNGAFPPPTSAAPPAAAPAGAPERPDDILTVRHNVSGVVIRVTRARYAQALAESAEDRDSTVLNAEPASAARPGDIGVEAPAAPTASPVAAPVAVPDAGAPYSPGASSTSGPWNATTGQPHMPDPHAAPSAPPTGMVPPPWVDQARYGQTYSPDKALARMFADPRMPNDAVIDAYQLIFGSKPKQATAGRAA